MHRFSFALQTFLLLADFTSRQLRHLHPLHSAEYNSSDSCNNNQVRFKLIAISEYISYCCQQRRKHINYTKRSLSSGSVTSVPPPAQRSCENCDPYSCLAGQQRDKTRARPPHKITPGSRCSQGTYRRPTSHLGKCNRVFRLPAKRITHFMQLCRNFITS